MTKLFTLQEIDKKPFSSFKDYVRKHNERYGYRYSKLAPSRRIVCSNCGGLGEAYDPKDRDPVEGYKMAERHRCIHCNGSGEWSPEEARVDYEVKIKNWKRESDKQKKVRLQQAGILKFVNASLTSVELRLLATMCRR